MPFSFFRWDQYSNKAGVKTIVQPGGSIRDQEVINAADKQELDDFYWNQTL